jgi:hypothetical protein
MPSLSTLPNGDSAWLLRKAIERIMQQVSVLETNIGSSTTGNSSNTQVIFNDNGTLRGDAGLVYNASTNTLTVGAATITGNLTVGTNTFFVDSVNNRVGVGTASPTSDLDIFRASGSGITSGISLRTAAGAGGDGSFIKWLAGGTNEKVAQIDGVLNGTDVGYLSFQCGNGADAMAEQYRIASSGIFSWFDGAGGTRMTLNSTGLGVGVTPSAGRGAIQLSAGVGFPATQVASSDANTLDDYEEGTFTPTLQFSGLSVGVTYSTQTGIYTKVGRIVHFSGRIDLSSKGTSVGNATISGLPFAANTGAASVGFQSLIAPSDKQVILTIDSTSLIVRYASGTTTAASTATDFSNSSILIFAGTYQV